MPSSQPPPFHDSFLDASGKNITESWKRFLLKQQTQVAIPGTLTIVGAFDATFTLTALTSVIFPTSGTLLTSATAVTNITGTANQIAASAAVGMVTLSLAGPHNFTTLAANGVLYGNGTSAILALAVNAAATRKFLSQASSNAPTWAALVAADLPADIAYTDVANLFTASQTFDTTTLFVDATNHRVGVGTITPSVPLHIFSAANVNTQVLVQNTDAIDAAAQADFATQADTASGAIIAHGSGRVVSRWGLTLGGWNEWRITAGNGLVIGCSTATPMLFGTNNLERMRLFSSGGLSLGNTTDPGGTNFSLTGKVTTYNAIPTVTNGVPSLVATIDTTGLTANVAASTLYAVPASGEALYRVSAYVVETTAGSVSSVLPNVQIIYTDKDSNVSVTIDATPILGAAGLGQTGALNANAGGTVSSGVIVIYVKASTTIQYQTSNYASVAAGMTYALRIRLEVL